MSGKIVRINPFFDPWYYEYYLQGIHQFYKDYRIEFDFSPTALNAFAKSGSIFQKDFFYYEVYDGVKGRSVYISTNDGCDINDRMYPEADVYAKVNIDGPTNLRYPKTFPIGPNFGIRYWSALRYFYHSLSIGKHYLVLNPFIRTYLKLSLKRLYYESYKPSATEQNYIFYLNYPWKKHTRVTDLRTEIIHVLKAMANESKIVFEGGFSRRRLGTFEGLENVSAARLYSTHDYLERVKKSTVVINTPAVHDCLGWKLGEYLALGKAIISTPISNRLMPGEFVAGTHYLEVKSVETDLPNAIKYLFADREARLEFQGHAHNYYNTYLKPNVVIERIHHQLFR